MIERLEQTKIDQKGEKENLTLDLVGAEREP